MSPRGATLVAFAYTVGAGVLLFGLYTYATSPGGHDPSAASVRFSVLAILAGSLMLALPAVYRRWSSLRRARPMPRNDDATSPLARTDPPAS